MTGSFFRSSVFKERFLLFGTTAFRSDGLHSITRFVSCQHFFGWKKPCRFLSRPPLISERQCIVYSASAEMSTPKCMELSRNLQEVYPMLHAIESISRARTPNRTSQSNHPFCGESLGLGEPASSLRPDLSMEAPPFGGTRRGGAGRPFADWAVPVDFSSPHPSPGSHRQDQ